LYEANRAGVQIRMVVRGICRLVPGVPGLSEHIFITSIIDRFLEHARIYIFHHGGDEKIYLASADWMTRNLSRRIEVAFPIFDEDLRREIRDVMDIQCRDNVKARIIDADQQNSYADANGAEPVCAQTVLYDYFREKDIGVRGKGQGQNPST
jgi:polyphosphate kinase